jgi:hypothetical protein
MTLLGIFMIILIVISVVVVVASVYRPTGTRMTGESDEEY